MSGLDDDSPITGHSPEPREENDDVPHANPSRMKKLAVVAPGGRIVCDVCHLADKPHTRLRGIMGWKSLRRGEGLLLRPTFSIHTAFVRFPIDAVFLDKEMTVVRFPTSSSPGVSPDTAGETVLELAGGRVQAARAPRRRPARVGGRLMASAVCTPPTTGETAGIRSISAAPGVVAVAAIAVAAAALVKFDLSGRALVAAFFAAVLVVLAAIDLERRIIPNRIVVQAGVIVLLGDIVAVPDRAKEWAFAAFVGAARRARDLPGHAGGSGWATSSSRSSSVPGSAPLSWGRLQLRCWRRSSSPSGSSCDAA